MLLQASNILVGRDGTVRLSDLGVAAKLERHFSCTLPEGYAKLERRNTFVGSPAYIAPELLTGLEQGYVLPSRIQSHDYLLLHAWYCPWTSKWSWQQYRQSASKHLFPPFCRYGLSADIYSFGITIIEVALGHTPYVDMSFRQIVTKKAANAGQPMLSVNTHGKHFSQVRKIASSNLLTPPSHKACRWEFVMFVGTPVHEQVSPLIYALQSMHACC